MTNQDPTVVSKKTYKFLFNLSDSLETEEKVVAM